MNDFAKVLYEKFFMRDFLGKLGPGAIVAVLFWKALASNSSISELANIPGFILWVVGVPLAYSLGLGLQILAEFIGIHSGSPAPRYILFFPTKFAANADIDERIALIGNADDSQWTDTNRSQWERYVVLKEAAGNMGSALLVFLILFATGLLGSELVGGKVLWVFGGVFTACCFMSHWIHANRQANYEIRTLELKDLITKEKAEKMKTRTWLT